MGVNRRARWANGPAVALGGLADQWTFGLGHYDPDAPAIAGAAETWRMDTSRSDRPGLTRRRLIASSIGAAGAASAAGLAGPVGTARADDQLLAFGWLNVKSLLYGALGDGSTDDTAAIQAAIDAAVAGGGGTILFPPGDYVVDGGLYVPASAPIRLMGSGLAMFDHSSRPTTLRRTSGETPLLTVAGESFARRAWIEISDMTFNGGARHGTGVVLHRCQNAYLHRVRIVSCSGTGLQCSQLFNSSGDNIYIHACGNGADEPAWLFDSVGAENQGGSATCHFTNVELEGNAGTDLKLTGTTYGGFHNPTVDVKFTNVKMEGGRGDFPYIHLDYATMVCFSNVNITMSGPNRTTTPIIETHPWGGTLGNQFSNVQITLAAGTPYGARLVQGAWQWSNVNVVGVRDHTAAFRIDPAVPTGVFKLDRSSVLTNMAKTVDDARPAPAVTAADQITLPRMDLENEVVVNPGADIRTITLLERGTRILLVFAGAVTVRDTPSGGNLNLADDFAARAGSTLELVARASEWREITRSLN